MLKSGDVFDEATELVDHVGSWANRRPGSLGEVLGAALAAHGLAHAVALSEIALMVAQDHPRAFARKVVSEWLSMVNQEMGTAFSLQGEGVDRGRLGSDS